MRAKAAGPLGQRSSEPGAFSRLHAIEEKQTMKKLVKRQVRVRRLTSPLDDAALASVTGGCFSGMPGS
jgi:hypothetical protein